MRWFDLSTYESVSTTIKLMNTSISTHSYHFCLYACAVRKCKMFPFSKFEGKIVVFTTVLSPGAPPPRRTMDCPPWLLCTSPLSTGHQLHTSTNLPDCGWGQHPGEKVSPWRVGSSRKKEWTRPAASTWRKAFNNYKLKNSDGCLPKRDSFNSKP